MSKLTPEQTEKVLNFFENEYGLEEYTRRLQVLKDRYVKCYLSTPEDDFCQVSKEEVLCDILDIDWFCESVATEKIDLV